MQALVALARAKGSIVTRDELIERCWDGRIVTDDAINRVLSRIRQIGSGVGGGSFTVETITKVGYRLVARNIPAGLRLGSFSTPVATEQASFGRRKVLTGSLVAGAAALAGGALWQRPWKHRPPPEAQELFRRGDLAQRAGTADQSRQSVSYFEGAVSIDPQYGKAWGALALAYTHNLDGFGEAELGSLPGRIRSAASRALKFDTDNADAQLALICIKPFFRNWLRMETDLRNLCHRYPRHWLAHGRLAIHLYQTGRLSDGVEFHKQVIGIDPMIVGPYAFAANALSSAGRVQEADSMLRDAYQRWPAHRLLWYVKYDHLLFSGRPQAAAAFLMDPDARPSGIGPSEVEHRLTLARAVDTGRPSDAQPVIDHFVRLAHEDALNIEQAAPIFSFFGRADFTFASLERYCFNRGSFGKPARIGPYTRRYTDTLFTAPMAAARRDPRFALLVRNLGLTAYWRDTRTVPDYLHPV
jgi:tetratricopeptide (TPR) repeat protein